MILIGIPKVGPPLIRKILCRLIWEQVNTGSAWSTPLGCFFTDTIVLTQPEAIEVEDSITVASFCQPNGAIDITPSGGTKGYSFYWDGPYSWDSDDEDVIDGPSGPYDFTLTDTNQCVYSASYFLPATEEIIITSTPSKYGIMEPPGNYYGISCNGDSSGYIIVNDIAGGSAPYDLKGV